MGSGSILIGTLVILRDCCCGSCCCCGGGGLRFVGWVFRGGGGDSSRSCRIFVEANQLERFIVCVSGACRMDQKKKKGGEEDL